MEGPVQKGERLWVGEGIAIFATNRAERLILTFEEAAVCEVAYLIHRLLKRHTLSSSFLERLDSRSFLLRRVDPLPIDLVVEAGLGESQVNLIASGGRQLTREEAARETGLLLARVDSMTDAATHAARALRGYLSLRGIDQLRLVTRFGLADDGTLLLQVINPLNCDLGTDRMAELAELLQGG